MVLNRSQTLVSSNLINAINSSNGKISGGNISGSGNTNGDTTSTISWNDQYGNNGSDTITVNIENTTNRTQHQLLI